MLLPTGTRVLTTIRSAAGLIGRHRQRWFAVVAVTSLVVSALEAVGALLVLALTQLLLDTSELPDLPVVGDPTRFVPAGVDPVTFFAVGILVFFLLRAGAALGQNWLSTRVAQRTGAELSGELVRGYLSMPYEFHLQRNSSEIVRNAIESVQQTIRGVLLPVIDLIAATAMSVVLLAVLVATSPVATLAAIAIMGLAVGLTLAIVQPRLQALGRRSLDASQVSYQQLQQGLDALRDVRLHGREEHFATRYQHAADEQADVWTRRALLSGVPRLTIEVSFFAFVVLALLVVSRTERAETLLPTLGLFAYAGLRLQPNLARFANAVNLLRYSRPGVDDLQADLAVLGQADASRRRSDRTAEPVPFEDHVALVGVGYGYPTSQGAALTDVDLTVRRGEWLGVCGPTGGGKSTLVDLLTGLVRPSVGVLAVDGVEVGDDARPWQRHLAMVHQTALLIDDTIRRNVALGTDDDAIDDAAVWAALRQAQLATFVEGLVDGLDTLVGERGIRLSGGQRQRLSLARALHRGADVLVLDEGTASLDNATERAVMDALAELDASTTVVMVAHRLSTLERCDRVVFVEDGRIAAVGTLEELARHSEGFRAMATAPAEA